MSSTVSVAAAAALIASGAVTADGTDIRLSVAGTGDQRRVEIVLKDAASGIPLRDAQPLAWLTPDESGVSCPTLMSKAVNAALDSAAITLNGVRIVAAFADGSLGLLDPQRRFAGTQLESALELGSPARSIVVSPSGDRLAVLTESGRLHLIDSSGALHRVASSVVDAESELAWYAGRVVVAGRGGVTLVDPLSGRASARLTQTLARNFRLRSGNSSLLWGSKSGPVEVAKGPDLNIEPIRGLVGLRDALWLDKPAAWLIADAAGRLVLVGDTASGPPLSALSGVRAMASDADGRFVLALLDEGRALALLDSADGRVLDRRNLPSRAERIVASRDFAYVHSAVGATVELVSFEVLRREHRIATVELPFGSERSAATPPFARIAIMPGGAVVIGQDGTTLFAYAEGMMVPMGSFAGLSRPLVGVAVIDRSLHETQPGIYTAVAQVPFGGAYRLPVKIGNPRVDACVPIQLPGTGRPRGPAAPGARFDSVHLMAEAGEPLAIRFSASSAAGRILALATDTTGRWQLHFPLIRGSAGEFSGSLRFPRPGTYRLVALDARATVVVREPRNDAGNTR